MHLVPGTKLQYNPNPTVQSSQSLVQTSGVVVRGVGNVVGAVGVFMHLALQNDTIWQIYPGLHVGQQLVVHINPFLVLGVGNVVGAVGVFMHLTEH